MIDNFYCNKKSENINYEVKKKTIGENEKSHDQRGFCNAKAINYFFGLPSPSMIQRAEN